MTIKEEVPVTHHIHPYWSFVIRCHWYLIGHWTLRHWSLLFSQLPGQPLNDHLSHNIDRCGPPGPDFKLGARLADEHVQPRDGRAAVGAGLAEQAGFEG